MKKKVLIDIKIVCDEPPYLGRWCRTEEDRLKEVGKWVKEFHDFIRDHRSQDPVFLSIEKIYQDQCSFCGLEWEEGQPACCDQALEDWRIGYNGK